MKKFIITLFVASVIVLSAVQLGVANTSATVQQQKSQLKAVNLNEGRTTPELLATAISAPAGATSTSPMGGAGTIPTRIVVLEPATTTKELTFHVGDHVAARAKLIRTDTGAGIPGALIGAKISPDGVNWLTLSYTLTTDSNGEVSLSGTVPDTSSLGYIPPVTGYGKVTYDGDSRYTGYETPVYTVTLLPASPTPTPTPSLSITSVQVVPGYTQYLEWDITNAGNADAFVAPNALIFKPTDTEPGYAQLCNATAVYAYDSTTGTMTTIYPNAGYGWFNVQAGHTYRVFSGPIVPADAKWAVYNAQLYYAGTFHGWLYTSGVHYSTLR